MRVLGRGGLANSETLTQSTFPKKGTDQSGLVTRTPSNPQQPLDRLFPWEFRGHRYPDKETTSQVLSDRQCQIGFAAGHYDFSGLCNALAETTFPSFAGLDISTPYSTKQSTLRSRYLLWEKQESSNRSWASGWLRLTLSAAARIRPAHPPAIRQVGRPMA